MSYLLGNQNNPSFNHSEWELWRENYLQNFAQFHEIYKDVDIAFEIDNEWRLWRQRIQVVDFDG